MTWARLGHGVLIGLAWIVEADTQIGGWVIRVWVYARTCECMRVIKRGRERNRERETNKERETKTHTHTKIETHR